MADSTPVAALPQLRVAHISDTHLAHEAYPARAASGWNLRGEDMVRAFNTAIDAIVASDPALVIHSGDMSEIPAPPIRYMLAIRSFLSKLASRRPDGTLRQVVVIAGNHDMPRQARGGCYLDLFSGIPGVHIVTSGIAQIAFEGADVPEELDRCVVTALPHESLRHLEDLGEPEPVPGVRNVLVAHGVAESTELFRRSVGREYAIPATLMVKDWSYVALGHWHTQGPVTPPGVSKSNSRIWYAGSTESVDFGDCKAATVSERGWLDVTLDAEDTLTVNRRTHPTRRMVTLPTLDITGMDPDEASAALVAAVRAASPDGAVIRQRVVAANRDVWAMVPLGPARDAASAALLYRVDVSFADAANLDSGDGAEDGSNALGAVGAMLAERAARMVPEADRDAALTLALTLAGAALGDPDLTDAAADEAADNGDRPATDTPPAAAEGALEGLEVAAPSAEVEAADGTATTGTPAAAPPPEPEPEPEPELTEAERFAAVLADLAEDGNIQLAHTATAEEQT